MEKKLPEGAYGGVRGEEYTPVVPEGEKSPAASVSLFLAGIVLAAVFSSTTAYAGMRSGLVVSAGIPGTIAGTWIVDHFYEKKGILGKNLLHAMASGGEAVAAGLIFMLPALLINQLDFRLWEGFLISAGGAVFGISSVTLLYKYLVVKQHGKLKYKESLVISETLVQEERAKRASRLLGAGGLFGGAFTLFAQPFLNLVNCMIRFQGGGSYTWRFEIEADPMLLGIGYIVGIKNAVVIFAASLLSYFGLIPLILYFTAMADIDVFVAANPEKLVKALGFDGVRQYYLLYVAAGVLLCGAVIGTMRAFKDIFLSLKEAVRIKGSKKASRSRWVMFLSAVIGTVLLFIFTQDPQVTIAGGGLLLVFSTLFGLASGRLTGALGTSNLPVMELSVTALIVFAGCFWLLGVPIRTWDRSVLFIGAFLAVAISSAAGLSRTQKTTYLLGGKRDEIRLFFSLAAFTGIFVTIASLLLLEDRIGTPSGQEFALPKANLISTLSSGITNQGFPLALLLGGVAMGLACFLFNVPVIMVGIGFYLPFSITMIMLLGALFRYALETRAKTPKIKKERAADGISLACGLLTGSSLVGLVGLMLQELGILSPTGPDGFFASRFAAFLFLSLLLAGSPLLYFMVKTKTPGNSA